MSIPARFASSIFHCSTSPSIVALVWDRILRHSITLHASQTHKVKDLCRLERHISLLYLISH